MNNNGAGEGYTVFLLYMLMPAIRPEVDFQHLSSRPPGKIWRCCGVECDQYWKAHCFWANPKWAMKNPSCLGWMMLPIYIYVGIMNSHCKAPVLNNQYMESKRACLLKAPRKKKRQESVSPTKLHGNRRSIHKIPLRKKEEYLWTRFLEREISRWLLMEEIPRSPPGMEKTL